VLAQAAGAQAGGARWPTRPVTLVVPYAAGGGTDIVSRAVAQRLTDLWGETVIVENRAGANGVIGSALVAKAAPDGHTLLMVVGSHAINPVLMKSLPYDTMRAFTPVTLLADSPMVMVVAANGPYKTLADFIAAARQAELGVGYSEAHTRLTAELIRQAAGIKTVGVAYKGGGPIMLDIIGGHLPAGVTSVLTALPHVRAGNLRVIGVAGKQRIPAFPDAPTFDESGLKEVESLSWYGLFGPAGMPADVVERINRDLRRVTSEPVLARQLADQGATVVLAPPDQFVTFLARETAKWARVAERGGIAAE